eukprot:421657-Prymnesium_polylepis.1
MGQSGLPRRRGVCVWRDAGSFQCRRVVRGCWAGWYADAADTCARASGRSSGAAAGQGALR